MLNTNHHRKSLTPLQEHVIRSRMRRNETASALAKEFNVSRRTIGRIVKKRVRSENSDPAHQSGRSISVEAPTRKRQVNLNLATQETIVRKLDEGSTFKQLAEEYQVSEMTVRRIKNKKERISRRIDSLKECDGDLNKTRLSGIEDSLLEKSLYAWICQQRLSNQPLTDDIIAEMASRINNESNGPANFKANSCWARHFRQRHNIHYVSMQGEQLSADEPGAECFCKTFNEFIKENDYDLDEVYNADESGLYWRGLPNKTLICANEKGAAGGKMQKDRVTLMFCANATGTHKIPLLLIGKYAKPRCFSKVDMSTFPVVYKSQKSAWVDKYIFNDWYVNTFLSEVEKRHPGTPDRPRKVLLLLDNAPCHPDVAELNSIDEKCQVRV